MRLLPPSQCYAVGAPVYLLRDVLVRAFYAQGDGSSPFWVSMAAIGMNALLDWYFVTQFGLGAQGLVMATVLVNLASVVLLYGMLVKKIGGLNMREVRISSSPIPRVFMIPIVFIRLEA